MPGVAEERGVRVTGFEQDADGAYSVVRKGLGLTFDGAAFKDRYMLGDVEVGWSIPRGYGIRSMHQTDGKTDDASWTPTEKAGCSSRGTPRISTRPPARRG